MSKTEKKQITKTRPTHAWDGLIPVFYSSILKAVLSLRSLSMLVNMVRAREVIYLAAICGSFMVIL